jgi:hypothetical protein
MRGSVWRYLGWQVRDRTGPRLLAAWLVVAALCLPLEFSQPDRAARSMFQSLHFQLACLAVIVLFHGIVAEDRVKGYYRFNLAKPVGSTVSRWSLRSPRWWPSARATWRSSR